MEAQNNLNEALEMPGGPSSSQSKRWTFTLNNYTELHCGRLESAFTEKLVSYVLYAKEIGASGTPHLQGYLEVPKKKTLNGLKKMLALPMHLSISKGSAEENLVYCSKQNPPVIFGTPMSQGSRSDLEAVRLQLRAGVPMLQVAESDFKSYVRYKRSFEGYRALVQETSEYDKPTVIVHWGVAGAGKTRFVYDNHNVENIWAWGGGSWFDGYEGHPIALFDDFDGSEIAYRQLLRLLDRYPIRVPVKGSFAAWRPKTIYITSNIRPQEWYNLSDVAALMRRLDTVTHFSGIK